MKKRKRAASPRSPLVDATAVLSGTNARTAPISLAIAPPPIAKGQRPLGISFCSPISNQTASALMAALAKAANEGHDDLHVLLSTPGGSVADGIASYNFMRALPVPITTYNIGTGDSIGNVVFQGGTYRVASTTSRFMFHGIGFDAQQGRLELKRLREKTQNIENDQAMIADILVRHTRLSTSDIERLFLEAAFMKSIDARERGIVDAVIDVELPPKMPIVQLVFPR